MNKLHTPRAHEGTYLTRMRWDIDRVERDYPEITLSATREMMV